MDNFQKIQEAKAFLKEQGYYTDNLWTIDDVQTNYKCTDEEAYGILDGALNNEATMDQIWFAINMYAQEDKLPKYIPHLYSINGYYKDDKSEFSDYLVCEYDSTPEGMDDDDIFYYGLSENDLIEAIKDQGADDNLDFVITSYERVVEK